MAKPSRQKRLINALTKIQNELEELSLIREELEDWRDNMPENMSESATMEKLEEVISGFEDELPEIEEAIDNLENLEFPKGFGRERAFYSERGIEMAASELETALGRMERDIKEMREFLACKRGLICSNLSRYATKAEIAYNKIVILISQRKYYSNILPTD